MKYIKQAFIIFFISFLGELLNKYIPLPVPAGVYGLVLLLGALCSGVVKLPDVENFGALMIEMMPLMFVEMMPLMFVPPAAGVIVHYKEVLSVIAPFTAAAIISTAAVMAATGFVTQRMMRRRDGGGK